MAETPTGPRPAARRRFVPVPIETTAESFRQGRKNDISLPTPGSGQGPHHTIGPAGELTPSPSPLSASPPPPPPPPVSSPPTTAAAARLWTKRRSGGRHAPRREKRHFAPQLVDFSRRSRRSGDVGPATRPTDKTDITPHQNHIYALRHHRSKHRKVQSLARRESCDDETAAHVFETLAREAEARMLEDAALAAFPNSRARAGGAEHFVLREGSEDDSYGSSRAATPGLASHDRKMPTTTMTTTTTTATTTAAAEAEGALPSQHAPRAAAAAHRRPTQRTAHRSRRDSSTEDVGWALRELQKHHEQLAKARAEQAAAAAAKSDKAVADEAVADDTRMDGATGDGGEAAAAARKTTTAGTPVRSASAAAAVTPARAVHTMADRISTLDLDRMSIESPPNDALWTTHAERRQTEDGMMGRSAGDSISMPYIPEETNVFPSDAEAYQGIPAYALRLREAERRGSGALDDSDDDYDVYPENAATLAATGERKGGLEAAEAAAAAAAAAGGTPGGEPGGFRGRNAYAGYRNRDIFASEREVERLRRKAPPMLGADLVFRQSASPQQTKLETDFLWHADDAAAAAAAGAATATSAAATREHTRLLERNRDATGTQGLWRGYCYTSTKDQAVVPAARPTLLATPFPQEPGAADPFAQAFAAQGGANAVHAEPASASEDEADEALTPPPAPTVSAGLWNPAAAAAPAAPEKKTKRAAGTGAAAAAAEAAAEPATGLHPLQRVSTTGDDVTVTTTATTTTTTAATTPAPAERDPALEAKIAAEFTDRFVTQVFNYLSLGYPAMARDYDEELAKIARITVAELQKDDDAVAGSAKGHISLGDGLFDADGGRIEDADADASLHNHASCPRWRALKLYIYEWARQHPDLDGGRGQPWGVQERRGSWGV